MMQQQTDTLTHTMDTAATQQPAAHHELTPAEVLSWLPRTATPAQMDSAIRANIKPCKITWSQCPDTLHLPGWPAGKSYKKFSLPQYYKESFFAKDSLFHPELRGGRLGVAGTPVPYTIANDDFFVSILLGGFVLIMVAFTQSKGFFMRQVKKFFYTNHSDNTTVIPETSSEIRFQVALMIQTCLMVALSFFFYTRTRIGETFMIETYQVIAIYVAVIMAYFLVKTALSWVVNWTFFGSKENLQIQKSNLFVAATEGVVLFPVVMLQTFFEMPVYFTLFYVGLTIASAKILTLCKQFIIFFSKNSLSFQIILYFCALEIVPLLMLWGGLTIINGYLKINF